MGTSIGKDTFDLAKLRYHKIIIMTDADVDGSHIRTLLLTLFYRQFPEIIERGHMYIAQPPLFRYKKGKVEKYLKDERELENFLISTTIDGSEVTVDKSKMDLTEIKAIINKYKYYNNSIKSYEQHFDSSLIKNLIESDFFVTNKLKTSDDVDKAIKYLTEYFSSQEGASLKKFKFVKETDTLTNESFIRVATKTNLKEKRLKLSRHMLESADFADLRNYFDGIKKFSDKRFNFSKAELKRDFDSLTDLANFIFTEGRQGAYIQRYKGLGEMNPEQLWETTMNPQNRILLQVKIEDTIDADQVFSILMGEHVEPRRDFVEKNALNVRNLDI